MIKGKEIELADGKKYMVPPLTLGAVECLQEKLQTYSGSMKDVGLVVDSALAALKRNYPEMKREDVAELIDLSNMHDVMFAVMNVSGLVEKSQGEVTATAEMSP